MCDINNKADKDSTYRGSLVDWSNSNGLDDWGWGIDGLDDWSWSIDGLVDWSWSINGLVDWSNWDGLDDWSSNSVGLDDWSWSINGLVGNWSRCIDCWGMVVKSTSISGSHDGQNDSSDLETKILHTALTLLQKKFYIFVVEILVTYSLHYCMFWRRVKNHKKIIGK